ARRSPSSPATGKSLRRSSRSASQNAATAPVPGGGRQPIAKRSHREPQREATSRSHSVRPQREAKGAMRRAESMQGGRMTRALTGLRMFVLALAVGLLASTGELAAQQPSSVNPTASSVKEQELLKALKKVEGRGSIPDTKSYVIQQPAGRDWRQFHEVTLHWIGGIAI